MAYKKWRTVSSLNHLFWHPIQYKFRFTMKQADRQCHLAAAGIDAVLASLYAPTDASV
jgi:hypothetical protein